MEKTLLVLTLKLYVDHISIVHHFEHHSPSRYLGLESIMKWKLESLTKTCWSMAMLYEGLCHCLHLMWCCVIVLATSSSLLNPFLVMTLATILIRLPSSQSIVVLKCLWVRCTQKFILKFKPQHDGYRWAPYNNSYWNF